MCFHNKHPKTHGSSGSGTAEEKIAAFEAIGVPVARLPIEIPVLIKKALKID